MRDATLSFVSIPFLTADEYVNFLTQKMKTSLVKTSEPICRNKALPNLAKEMLPVFTLHPHYKSHKGKLSRIRTVEGTLLLKYFWKQLKLARYDPKKKESFWKQHKPAPCCIMTRASPCPKECPPSVMLLLSISN